MERRVNHALECASKIDFNALNGGVHSLNNDSIKLIIKNLNLSVGECVLEIGCGIPRLAFALSAATLAPVICTDLGENTMYLNLLINFS